MSLLLVHSKNTSIVRRYGSQMHVLIILRECNTFWNYLGMSIYEDLFTCTNELFASELIRCSASETQRKKTNTLVASANTL